MCTIHKKTIIILSLFSVALISFDVKAMEEDRKRHRDEKQEVKESDTKRQRTDYVEAEDKDHASDYDPDFKAALELSLQSFQEETQRQAVMQQALEQKQEQPQSGLFQLFSGVSDMFGSVRDFLSGNSLQAFLRKNKSCDQTLLLERLTKADAGILDLSKLNLENVEHLISLIPKEKMGKFQTLNLSDNKKLENIPSNLNKLFNKVGESKLILANTGLLEGPDAQVLNNIQILKTLLQELKNLQLVAPDLIYFLLDNPSCNKTLLEIRFNEAHHNDYKNLDLKNLNLENIDRLHLLIPEDKQKNLHKLNLSDNKGLKTLPLDFEQLFYRESKDVVINFLRTGLFNGKDAQIQANIGIIRILWDKYASIEAPNFIYILLDNPLADLNLVRARFEQAETKNYQELDLSGLNLVDINSIANFIDQKDRKDLRPRVLNLSHNKDLKQIKLNSLKEFFGEEKNPTLDITDTGFIADDNPEIVQAIQAIHQLRREGYRITTGFDDIRKLFLLENPACDNDLLQARLDHAETKNYQEFDLSGLELKNIESLFSLIPEEKRANIRTLNLANNNLASFAFTPALSNIETIDLSNNKELQEITFTQDVKNLFDDESKPTIDLRNTSLFPAEGNRIRVCNNYKVLHQLKTRGYLIHTDISAWGDCVICLSNKVCVIMPCCGTRICTTCCEKDNRRRCPFNADAQRDNLVSAGMPAYTIPNFHDIQPPISHQVCLQCLHQRCPQCRSASNILVLR